MRGKAFKQQLLKSKLSTPSSPSSCPTRPTAIIPWAFLTTCGGQSVRIHLGNIASETLSCFSDGDLSAATVRPARLHSCRVWNLFPHNLADKPVWTCSESCGHQGSIESLQQPSETSGSPERAPKKRGKKKLPVPDLDAIADPDERRRQRRLVKNRNTAAASR